MNRGDSESGLGVANNANDKIAMLNRLKQQQAQAYQRKKTNLGVGQRTGTMQLGAQMTLEDMNLDRKNNFEGDAFDPFKIGHSSNMNANIQLQAQNAYLDKANSQGGHIWTPE